MYLHEYISVKSGQRRGNQECALASVGPDLAHRQEWAHVRVLCRDRVR